jgi:hypothetical protein
MHNLWWMSPSLSRHIISQFQGEPTTDPLLSIFQESNFLALRWNADFKMSKNWQCRLPKCRKIDNADFQNVEKRTMPTFLDLILPTPPPLRLGPQRWW